MTEVEIAKALHDAYAHQATLLGYTAVATAWEHLPPLGREVRIKAVRECLDKGTIEVGRGSRSGLRMSFDPEFFLNHLKRQGVRSIPIIATMFQEAFPDVEEAEAKRTIMKWYNKNFVTEGEQAT